jgi:site-specific recombinase XerD
MLPGAPPTAACRPPTPGRGATALAGPAGEAPHWPASVASAGDYELRKVDPRIPAFVAWVAAQPLPEARGDKTARLVALRARALILTLYCSGLRREEATALETAEVLRAAQPGEADVRGKGDRARTVFLDAAALEAVQRYVEARGRWHRRAACRPQATPL